MARQTFATLNLLQPSNMWLTVHGGSLRQLITCRKHAFHWVTFIDINQEQYYKMV